MSYFDQLISVEKIKPRPKPLWRLNRDLRYLSELVGDFIVVPQGFVTDFASVPRMPVAFLLTGGKGDEAAVVHDWLYSTQAFPRAKCDAVFKEALQVMGYSASTVNLMYSGVRAGGWVNWGYDNVPQTPEVQAKMVAA